MLILKSVDHYLANECLHIITLKQDPLPTPNHAVYRGGL